MRETAFLFFVFLLNTGSLGMDVEKQNNMESLQVNQTKWKQDKIVLVKTTNSSSGHTEIVATCPICQNTKTNGFLGGDPNLGANMVYSRASNMAQRHLADVHGAEILQTSREEVLFNYPCEQDNDE